MIDWDRIAQKLSQHYNLPIKVLWCDTEIIMDNIVFLPIYDAFLFSSQNLAYACSKLCSNFENITKQHAVKMLWNTFTEQEKTELMASILGRHDL